MPSSGCPDRYEVAGRYNRTHAEVDAMDAESRASIVIHTAPLVRSIEVVSQMLEATSAAPTREV